MHACLNYLAKRGDKEALRILNDNYFKYGSSLEWAETVECFGKYTSKGQTSGGFLSATPSKEGALESSPRNADFSHVHWGVPIFVDSILALCYI
jgi:hypothetical protein